MTTRPDGPLALTAVMRQAEAACALADPVLASAGAIRVAEGAHAAILVPEAARGRLFARRARLARALVERQRSIERLVGAGDVLALRGAPRLTPSEARAMLVAGTDEIAAALARIAGRVQYQITVEAGVPDPRGPEIASTVLAALLAEVEDAVELPRDGPSCLLNIAVLLARTGLDRLEAALEAVDAASPVALAIRLVGPNAPVSFAAIEIARAEPGALARARRVLGLAPDDGDSDPARAFRKAVLAAAGPAGPACDMDTLCRARDLLLSERAGRARLAARGLVVERLPLLGIRRDAAAPLAPRRSAA